MRSVRQKLEICRAKQNGSSYTTLSKKYKTSISSIKYLYRLYLAHGEEAFSTHKQKYTVEQKIEAVNKVAAGNSVRTVAIEYKLQDPSTLRTWIKQSKEQVYPFGKAQ